MSLAVSIVSHGHGAQIQSLLQLLAQTSVPSVQRVWITCNCPESPPVAASWPFDVRWLHNAVPQGFGANHNQAFRHEQGCLSPAEFFAVLNPDLTWTQDPFSSLLVAAAQWRAGCAYPQQVTPQGLRQDHQRSLPTPMSLLRRYVAPHNRLPVPIDWVNAACLLFPSSVFREVGGFDENFYMYCEDVDLCLRLRLQGYDLMESKHATVVHEAQRNSHRQWRHCMWHLVSLWRLWHSPPYRQYKRQQNTCQK